MNTINGINKKRTLRLCGLSLLFALGTLLPGRVWAWDGWTVGQVASIQVYSDGSGFQFTLVGGPNLCPISGATGSGNVTLESGATPDGIRAMLATLREAKIFGYTIRVYANNNDPALNRGCDVGAIDFDPSN